MTAYCPHPRTLLVQGLSLHRDREDSKALLISPSPYVMEGAGWGCRHPPRDILPEGRGAHFARRDTDLEPAPMPFSPLCKARKAGSDRRLLFPTTNGLPLRANSCLGVPHEPWKSRRDSNLKASPQS